jgi:hypothetical protein
LGEGAREVERPFRFYLTTRTAPQNHAGVPDKELAVAQYQ